MFKGVIGYHDKLKEGSFPFRLRRMLNRIWVGFYHLISSDNKLIVDGLVAEVVYEQPMATYDGSLLTRIVYFAHQEGIRVEIRPKSKKRFLITFMDNDHPGMYGRHSTLKDAIEDIEKEKPGKDYPTIDW